MSQALLNFILIGLLAFGLVLYILDPSYVIILVKAIFTLINLIFAGFVFRHLIDMNNHYKSKLYPLLFLAGFGVVAIPVLVLISLFL